MDSKFTLFYFPIHGKAEALRLILAYAKANWENKMVSDWPNEKFNTEGLLYKQVPLLIEKTASGEERRLVQSCAITHYLATIFKLETDDVFKNATLACYFEGVNEINDKINKYMYLARAENLELSEIVKRIRADENITNFIKYNEEILAKNGGNGYYLDNKVTYVDICAFNLVDKYIHIPGIEDLFTKEKTPLIMKVYENVANLPEIKAYLQSEKRLDYRKYN